MVSVCVLTLENILLASIHLFTNQMVASYLCCVDPQLIVILFTSSSYVAYKLLPSIKIFLRVGHFFIPFHHTLYCGLDGACVNPGIYFQILFYAFTSLFVQYVSPSFLNRLQPNLCQHFSHICPTCHYFEPEENT